MDIKQIANDQARPFFRQYGWMLLIWTLILSCPASSWSAQQSQALDDATENLIVAKVNRWMQDRGVPGMSVAIGVDNQLAWQRGFGLADVEHGIEVKPETRFRTASIAKSLTAVALMSLVEDGKLDLDQPVQQYCPDYPDKQWPVTVRQVMGHLGGVRHYKTADEASSTEHYFTLSEALQTFADDPLRHEPGTRYLYSSFGYNLLGSVAEGAAQQDFMTLLAERVFQPAGMQQTVADDTFAVVKNRSRGYFRPTKSYLDNRYRDRQHHLVAGELYNSTLHDTSMKIPGGGLLSTSPDLVRFANAVNRVELIPQSLVEQMWTRQKLRSGQLSTYGLGWRIGKQFDRSAVWHTGGQSGTSTVLLLFPEDDVSVAIMCNLQSTRLTGLATSLAEVILSQRDEKPAAESPQKRHAEVIEKLKQAVAYEVEQKDLPAFSIAMVNDQGLIWSQGYGYEDEQQTTPATGTTVYRVGSISKLLTDISVMQLVEKGELDLDAPVSKYLSEFKPGNESGTPITVRQLMNHRSGLVRESPVGNYFDASSPSLAETVDSLNQTAVVYPPGTRTKYSNAAVSVVGAILEAKLEGQHADLVQREIFQPLGMEHSSFVLSPNVEPHLAHAKMWTYDDRRFTAPTFLLGTGPAGNLYSTVEDLAKFVSLIFNRGRTADGQVLRPETMDLMTSPQTDQDGNPTRFGIGFHVGELDGHKLVGHGGAVYGFSTQLEVLPEPKLGVVAASALDGSNGVTTRLSHYALRLLLAEQDGKPLPDYPRTGDIDVRRVRELAGEYVADGGEERVRIDELGGRAFLERGTFRHQLRARENDGTLMVDDAIGFGTLVERVDAGTLSIGGKRFLRVADQPPATIPDRWEGLIGEYGEDHNVLYILERDGKLWALIEWFYYYPLEEVGENEFLFPDYGLYHGEGLKFKRDDTGRAREVVAAEVLFRRRDVGTIAGETFRITPVKPIAELREAALAAEPPNEPGQFRQPDLEQLTELDPSIALDIRYATTNNFTGSQFYQQPRAFMQRPAAEAVVRAHRRLKDRGLGLLIHDAYRPWHVTKMFWDATPSDMKDFVANPANGSRHNRGCAVDLTLYDLASGEPIQMVAGYDEFSPRSFPMYPGGTSRQRWYRSLLRRTMEAEGFDVYEFEWWHFDFKDWKQYRIGNRTFEQILK